MFTGIVEEVGVVRRVAGGGKYRAFDIEAGRVLVGTAAGDSIAVNGACQTVTDIGRGFFRIETLAVTLEKTTLGSLQTGSRVNLERAVTPSGRLGGHFVQGHVDGTGVVTSVRREERNIYFSLTLPRELLPYVVAEGSIAVEGVSLTVASLKDDEIMVNVIPVTWRDTVLSDRRRGEAVNIEVDIIGRYVARLLGFAAGHGYGRSRHDEQPVGLSARRLQDLGF